MTTSNKLDLSCLPPIHILPPHLTDEELHKLEELLEQSNAPLTYSYDEAQLYLADINTVRRCELELKKRGLWTKKLDTDADPSKGIFNAEGAGIPQDDTKRFIKVVKLKWFRESVAAGKLLDINPYLIYSGQVIPPPLEPSEQDTPQITDISEAESTRSSTPFKHTFPLSRRSPTETQHPAKRPRLEATPEFNARKHAVAILQRARQDAQEHGGNDTRHIKGWNSRGATPQRDRKIAADTLSLISHKKLPKLKRISTDEWEREQQLKATREVPEYVKDGLRYACLRPHPLSCPNDHFISLLNVIKLSRILSLDPIGVRAYSTVISSIKAYPYEIVSSNEISKLPGCDGKTSSLFHEYIHSSSDPSKRTLQVVQELQSNEEFQMLSLFYGIWGVGAKTAREFYFEHGWRSLDDIIEFGWDKLTRVQQIGLKYYDEFNNIKIPRWEVERIAKIINDTANKLRSGYEHIICGGYRRGKAESGDVDMVISHRDENMTKGGFTGLLIEALEKSGFVTHTLYLGRGGGFGSNHRLEHSGHHFGAVENLEKAMVVWQEQELPWTGTEENPHNWIPGMKGGQKKNPHPHRRVDIILSPPSTVGTAILGWTGATTYERDMRRFVEHSRGWKFDSGGVWDRRTGGRIEELGRWEIGETLVECEKRVIEGMGMPYFPPELRNTG